MIQPTSGKLLRAYKFSKKFLCHSWTCLSRQVVIEPKVQGSLLLCVLAILCANKEHFEL